MSEVSLYEVVPAFGESVVAVVNVPFVSRSAVRLVGVYPCSGVQLKPTEHAELTPIVNVAGVTATPPPPPLLPSPGPGNTILADA